MTRPVHRFIFLDGLRGVAALSVAWLHGLEIARVDNAGFNNVGLAVDFFFCLSGFVVAYAYDGRLHGEMTILEFVQKRMIRLYPMIAVGILIGSIAAVYRGDSSISSAGANLVAYALLLPVGLQTGSLTYPINVPMWSLFFEIFACVAYACSTKILPDKWIPYVVISAAILLVSAIFVAGYVTRFGVYGAVNFVGGFVRVTYPFLIGVLMFRWSAHERLGAWPSFAVLIFLLTVLFMPELGRFGAPFHIVATIVLLPLIVLLGAGVNVGQSGLWTLFGRLSYPLYLIHWPTFIFTEKLLRGVLPPLGLTLIGLGVALLSAYMFLVVFDEPVRRWLSARQRVALAVD